MAGVGGSRVRPRRCASGHEPSSYAITLERMALQSNSRAAAAIRAILLLLGASLMFVLAHSLSWQFVHDVVLARQSALWPSVAGYVDTSQATLGPRSQGTVPRVEYVYIVANHAYSGNRVLFGNVNGSRGWAEGVVAQFPVGPVRVFYSPQEPNESVLLPESIGATTYLGLLIGLIFCMFGSYLVFRAVRAGRKAL